VGSVRDVVKPYLRIIDLFVDGQISADQFEEQYLKIFKSEKSIVGGDEFRLLERLFFDVDDYVSSSELRKDVGGLDAEQLRARAAECRDRLLG
jgi:self-protective colicin-like immunity protein